MEHEQVRELLPAYSLGACDPQEVARLEGHLERCGECRAELGGLELAVGALAVVRPEVQGLAEIKAAALARLGQAGSVRPRRRLTAVLSGALAASLVAVAGLGFGYFEQQRAIQTSPKQAQMVRLFTDHPAFYMLAPMQSGVQAGLLVVNGRSRLLGVEATLTPGTYWLWIRDQWGWASFRRLSVSKQTSGFATVISITHSEVIGGVYICPAGPKGFSHPLLQWVGSPLQSTAPQSG